jgi:O-antigen ligase
LGFRLFVWHAILDEWQKHPLTGIGPGMTAKVVERQSAATRAAPHNDYIGIFSELSVPGIALYVAIQFMVVFAAARCALHTTEPRRGMVTMIVILFVSLNIFGALNNPLYFFDIQLGLWALVGAAIEFPQVPAFRRDRRTAMSSGR